MNTYIVSYDLQRPGKDYSTLIEHLKSYPGWAKPLESVWLIKSSLGISDFTNQISIKIDQNDKLIVVEVTKKPVAWVNLDQEVINWINKNL